MTDSAKRQAAEDAYYAAVDAFAEGDSALAIEKFRAAIAADTRFTDAWHGLIRALQDSGNLDAALVAALQLVVLEPNDVLAHTRLSILYQIQGRIPEAEAEAAKARVLGWKRELESKRPTAMNSAR